MPSADCDFDDYVFEEEECIKEDIDVNKNITILPEIAIRADINEYAVSRIFYKKLFNTNKGVKCSPDHYTHYERNQSNICDKYINPLFNDWQNELCDKITDGHNVIAQVATSCGKTWATNLIISYYVLQSNSTALFITPNYEILRDNTTEILEKNHKVYLHPGSYIIDTQTRRFSSYVESGKTKAQILCITADNLISFATNDANHDFINKLKYVIFDEVHLPEVYNTIKWVGLMPNAEKDIHNKIKKNKSKKVSKHSAGSEKPKHSAGSEKPKHSAGSEKPKHVVVPGIQYILLSATITTDNISLFKRHLLHYSPNETAIITYDIRPVSLQFLHLKKDKTDAKILTRQCSILDPTKADIEQITGTSIDTPREVWYATGQEVIKENLSVIIESITKKIKDADLSPSIENLYRILRYLFAKDMQPVIIFGMTARHVKEMCVNMCTYINYLESIDERHNALCKSLARYQKLAEEANIRIEKKKGSAHRSGSDIGTDIGTGTGTECDDDSNVENYNAIIRATISKINRYKFPNLNEYIYFKASFEKNMLDYGIGVNISYTKTKIKNKIFDLFKTGKIKVLFADTSISVGINLPIRTCIIVDEDGAHINYSLFKQMSGRAGRRGFDTVGYVIPMFPEEILTEYLTTTKIASSDISITPILQSIDIIKLLAPEELSNYYYGDKKEIILSKINMNVSKLRKKIMAKYISIFDERDFIEKIARLGLHNNVFTNIINTSHEPATIIIMKMLQNGDMKIKTDNEFINLIATLLCRYPGDKVLIPRELMDVITTIGVDNSHDYETAINPWLNLWYTGQLNRLETNKYVENISYICHYLFNLLNHFKEICLKSNTFKSILIETDRKYMNMKKIMGID